MDAVTYELTGGEYKIPATNLNDFKRRFERLAKRAVKLGVPAPVFEVLRRHEQRKETGYYDPETGAPIMRSVVYYFVQVSGHAPKLAGWTFVGRLDFKSIPGGVLRAMVPGETCPTHLMDVEPGRCDHCGKTRRRSDVFIVRHEDGRELVVGRNCLADFLGHQSPQTIAAAALFATELRCIADGESFGGWCRPKNEWDVYEVLLWAAVLIRLHGFVSKREAMGTGRWPTAQDRKSTRLNSSH